VRKKKRIKERRIVEEDLGDIANAQTQFEEMVDQGEHFKPIFDFMRGFVLSAQTPVVERFIAEYKRGEHTRQTIDLFSDIINKGDVTDLESTLNKLRRLESLKTDEVSYSVIRSYINHYGRWDDLWSKPGSSADIREAGRKILFEVPRIDEIVDLFTQAMEDEEKRTSFNRLHLHKDHPDLRSKEAFAASVYHDFNQGFNLKDVQIQVRHAHRFRKTNPTLYRMLSTHRLVFPFMYTRGESTGTFKRLQPYFGLAEEGVSDELLGTIDHYCLSHFYSSLIRARERGLVVLFTNKPPSERFEILGRHVYGDLLKLSSHVRNLLCDDRLATTLFNRFSQWTQDEPPPFTYDANLSREANLANLFDYFRLSGTGNLDIEEVVCACKKLCEMEKPEILTKLFDGYAKTNGFFQLEENWDKLQKLLTLGVDEQTASSFLAEEQFDSLYYPANIDSFVGIVNDPELMNIFYQLTGKQRRGTNQTINDVLSYLLRDENQYKKKGYGSVRALEELLNNMRNLNPELRQQLYKAKDASVYVLNTFSYGLALVQGNPRLIDIVQLIINSTPTELKRYFSEGLGKKDIQKFNNSTIEDIVADICKKFKKPTTSTSLYHLPLFISLARVMSGKNSEARYFIQQTEEEHSYDPFRMHSALDFIEESCILPPLQIPKRKKKKSPDDLTLRDTTNLTDVSDNLMKLCVYYFNEERSEATGNVLRDEYLHALVTAFKKGYDPFSIRMLNEVFEATIENVADSLGYKKRQKEIQSNHKREIQTARLKSLFHLTREKRRKARVNAERRVKAKYELAHSRSFIKLTYEPITPSMKDLEMAGVYQFLDMLRLRLRKADHRVMGDVGRAIHIGAVETFSNVFNLIGDCRRYSKDKMLVDYSYYSDMISDALKQQVGITGEQIQEAKRRHPLMVLLGNPHLGILHYEEFLDHIISKEYIKGLPLECFADSMEDALQRQYRLLRLLQDLHGSDITTYEEKIPTDSNNSTYKLDVRIGDSDVLTTFVKLYESSKKGNFMTERDLTSQFGDRLKKYEINLAHHIRAYTKEINGRYIMVSNFLRGELLADYVNNAVKMGEASEIDRCFLECSEVIAHIHDESKSVSMLEERMSQVNESTLVEDNLKVKFYDRLERAGIDLPSYEDFGSDTSNLTGLLSNSMREDPVYVKGAHLNNWMVAGGIIPIDFEGERVGCSLMDLTLLTEFGLQGEDGSYKPIEDSLKNRIVEKYISSRNVGNVHSADDLQRLFAQAAFYTNLAFLGSSIRDVRASEGDKKLKYVKKANFHLNNIYHQNDMLDANPVLKPILLRIGEYLQAA